MTSDELFPATEAVKHLHAFLSGDQGESTCGNAERELRDAGVDISKMAAAIRKKIAQAQNRLRLEENRARRPTFVEQITESLGGQAVTDIKEEIKRVIGRLAGIQPELAGVFYRKLEASTDEDLSSLLSDLNELAKQQGDHEAENGR